jgi:hypothetical protein
MTRHARTQVRPSGQTRWTVPYTAPGSKGGQVTVLATSREDALNAVAELHRKRSTHGTTGDPSWRLSQRERAGIEYGEPYPVDEAGQPLLLDDQAPAHRAAS